MQYIIKYQQNAETHALHIKIPATKLNPCNTQSNTNKLIKAIQKLIKYQQNKKTHAIHNQIPTTR